MRARPLVKSIVLSLALTGCGSSSSSSNGTLGGSAPGATGSGGAGVFAAGGGTASGGHGGGAASGGAGATSGSAGASGHGAQAGGGGAGPGATAGWLYTSGSKILISDGKGGGTPWMGRGVNLTDLYLCGYNNTLWMSGAEQALENVVSNLVSGWKANFVRISLSMASFPSATSWLQNPAQYKTPMTNVINAIGTHPNLYVLVTLRSDASMIGEDTASNDPEATGLPSDATTTPSASAYPTGTDATYVALVDSFATAPFVLFGLTNEPGGSTLSDAKIGAAMNHAVGVIRAEEDRLGVPHHVVSVQGNGYTSNIAFYAATPAPISHDNVVYEVHGYPPSTSSYSYANIPVILGEYGSLDSNSAAAFYGDLEAKQISNLAWDFDSYAGCAPDLLTTNQSDTNLLPTTWGSIVQSYLLMHAR